MPTIGRAWAKWAEIASRQATLYRQEALKLVGRMDRVRAGLGLGFGLGPGLGWA